MGTPLSHSVAIKEVKPPSFSPSNSLIILARGPMRYPKLSKVWMCPCATRFPNCSSCQFSRVCTHSKSDCCVSNDQPTRAAQDFQIVRAANSHEYAPIRRVIAAVLMTNQPVRHKISKLFELPILTSMHPFEENWQLEQFGN